MRVIEMSREQHRNERVGEKGDTQENPPTNGIVRLLVRVRVITTARTATCRYRVIGCHNHTSFTISRPPITAPKRRHKRLTHCAEWAHEFPSVELKLMSERVAEFRAIEDEEREKLPAEGKSATAGACLGGGGGERDEHIARDEEMLVQRWSCYQLSHTHQMVSRYCYNRKLKTGCLWDDAYAAGLFRCRSDKNLSLMNHRLASITELTYPESLTWSPDDWFVRTRFRFIEKRQHWNAKGRAGYPRENPPTSGIVRHDSNMQESGIDRPRNRTPSSPRRDTSMSWTMLRLEQNGWRGETYIKKKYNSTDREGAGGLWVHGRGHSTVGCYGGPAERLVSCVRARRRLVVRADTWESRSLVCSDVGGRKDTRASNEPERRRGLASRLQRVVSQTHRGEFNHSYVKYLRSHPPRLCGVDACSTYPTCVLSTGSMGRLKHASEVRSTDTLFVLQHWTAFLPAAPSKLMRTEFGVRTLFMSSWAHNHPSPLRQSSDRLTDGRLTDAKDG
ncbi:hypothetical protein PR048_025037 [Dryococelus australis]|uniref:Uncharacterized protein n=1 Tax=Dryococelus australis TaxID=614101 RepID=A0ABQ9GQ88_9NEOP|nr:hypothetical protein PR048_025037 [Dryococelus australis]